MDLEKFAANSSDLDGLFAKQTCQNPGTKRRRIRPQLDLPRHDPDGRFVKGPIPLSWLKIASQCGGRGGRGEAVALLLWYAAGWQKCNPVKLTTTILAELRIHPKTARRLLVRFELAGLVSVDARRGACPVVTILTPSDWLVVTGDSAKPQS